MPRRREDPHPDPADVTPDVLRRRPTIRVVVLLVIGAVFGAVGTLTWSAAPSGRLVEGTVGAVDPSGSALLLATPEDMGDVGLGLVGVLWREEGGEWQRTLSPTGFPTCIEPGEEGLEVRLGLVTDPGGVGRPPSEVVAWVECIGP